MKEFFKKKIVKNLLIVFGSILSIIFIMNLYVVLSVSNRVIETKDYKDIKDVECIIVLGAGIRTDKPSNLLRDRLDIAIDLYFEGVAPKILMSGDHGRKEQKRYRCP